jgi:XTP/dITP diphosphohydrolase
LIRLYCATGNAGKLREYQLALGHAPVAIELLPGFRDLPPAVEDGATFEENAVRKALHYSPHVSGLLFADDSGLEVDALDGAPGVYSARFAGPRATDEANNRLLLEKLRALPGNRFPFTARFICRIALVERDRLVGVYSGSLEGLILDAPRGQAGFGYDPLFFYPPFGCTFGEADAPSKFEVSHRGQALRAMIDSLTPLAVSH